MAFTRNQLAQLSAPFVREERRRVLQEAAQVAFDQTSDDPQPGDWNEACEHIADCILALIDREEPSRG